ncbi:MAG TPA: Ig-like domain-containing protein, partial [Longimicrobiales bacterium]|nr:Ig-like domain-containing protein [Longimicrobiales bacterium]
VVEGVDVTWSSDDESVATVSAEGEVTAVAAGTVEILAVAGELQARAVITVVATGDPATLSLQPEAVRLEAIGDTAVLVVEAADAFGNDLSADVVWDMADTTVASLVDGVVEARRAGATEITVSLGALEAFATVEVEQVPASLTVSPAVDTLEVDEDVALTADVLDANGHEVAGAAVAWSAGGGVVEVSPEGVVTGRSPGGTRVIASSDAGVGGTVADTAIIIVLTPPTPDSVAVDELVEGWLPSSGVDTLWVELEDRTGYNAFVAPDGEGAVTAEVLSLDGASVEASVTNDTGLPLDEAASGTFSFYAAGSYPVVVSGDPGPWSMRIRRLDLTVEGAADTLALGDTIHTTIDYLGDIDFVWVELTAGQEVNLLASFDPASTVDPALGGLDFMLSYEGAASLILQLDASAAGADHGQHASGVFTPDDTGPHAIIVRGGDAATGGFVGDYALTVHPTDPAPEIRTDLVGTTRGVIGDSVAGEAIAPLGDVDEFTFEAAAGETFVFYFTMAYGGQGAITAELLAPDGSLVVEAERVPETLPLQFWVVDHVVAEQAGEYTLRFTGDGSASGGTLGDYRFWLVPIDLAPEVEAAALTPMDTVDLETIDPRGDIDQFTFHGEAGEYIQVLFQNLGVPGWLDGTIFSPAGDTLALIRSYDGVDGEKDLRDVPLRRLLLEETGEYTVRANAREVTSRTAIGPYRLMLATLDTLPETASPALVVGDTVSEALDLPGDMDTFTLSTTVGSYHQVSLENVTGTGWPIRVDVYDPSGTLVATMNVNDGDGFVSTEVLLITEPGDYTVFVHDGVLTGTGKIWGD